MLLEMSCKRHFFEGGHVGCFLVFFLFCFFVCLFLLKLLDLVRETTEGFFSFRQVLEALKNLTGFRLRKPQFDLKNLS